MCQLIVKPSGVSINEEVLFSAYATNADGTGYATVIDGEVVIKKGFEVFKTFYEDYIKTTEEESSAALIHFRNVSRGTKSLENTHPFKVGAYAFAHNGTFKESILNDGRSDSRTVAERLHNLVTIYPNIIEDRAFQDLLLEFMGLNKVAFLKPDGTFIILNEKYWSYSTKDGVKFSSLAGTYRLKHKDATGVQVYGGNTLHRCSDCGDLINSSYEKMRFRCMKCLLNQYAEDYGKHQGLDLVY